MKKILFILPIVSSLMGCGNNNPVADTVVLGNIYTAEKENNGLAEAFAVKDGKFIYVGNKAGVTKYIKEGTTNVINKEEGLVIPGATEGHGHFLGIDSVVKKLPCYNKDYKYIKDYLNGLTTKPKFHISWGLDYESYAMGETEKWDLGMNYAKDLDDTVANDYPIICIDNSGHQALCNGYALKKAKLIDNDYKKLNDVRGGLLLYNENEDISGWVCDELVMYVIRENIDFSSYGDEFFMDSTKSAIAELNSRGFTNYLEAYVNVFTEDGFHKAMNTLDKKNELTCNIASYSTVRSFEDKEYETKIENIKSLADQYQSKHFDPHNVKLFADGVVEAFTGWMFDEYPINWLIDKGDHGNIIWSPEELAKLVLKANQLGLNVHTHTFGDAACHFTIDAYIEAEKQLGKHFNNSLAHVKNIQDSDISRVALHKIGVASNMIWHSTSIENDEHYQENFDFMAALYPEGAYANGYPMKSFIKKGARICSSTDAPCGEKVKGNIQNIIEVATTGIDPEFNGVSFNTDELLTVKEALDCLTINGAEQLGIEDKCGSIKVNKNADFVILDKNFLNYTELNDLRSIHNANIENVYFEGNVVFPKNS
ncbi:MAG: amidohydrolase family protein [Bacilli bacterium]|nr:amidohydrolase family protein [Bacilli bacterium]